MTQEPGSYPVDGTLQDQVRYLADVAGRAPSAHNAQPWECRLIGSELHIGRHDAYALDASDPTGRQTALSLAMYVEAFVVAAHRWGIRARVTRTAQVPGDRTTAVLALTGCAPAGDSPVYRAISDRHTDRGPYAPLAAPAWLDSGGPAASGADTRLFPITDRDAVARIGGLAGSGLGTALSLLPMRRELAGLVHWHGEPATRGMAVEALFPGTERRDMPAAEWFREHADAEEAAASVRDVYATAPGLVVVVATRADDPTAWCDAGRAAYRLLLRAAADGLAHDIQAGPVEIPALAAGLAAELEHGWRPQILLRIGRPLGPRLSGRSVRRAVAVD
ncbi:hypothetical protein [Streptomyces sp. NRRL F-5123]|uniref:hypothetical protein n=1 Tax=Streptomyces sp. NRRL F-5123 TaxID=1463856 RepID=UPI0004E1FF15|nr:hypothetical protein [Streptomyces sp. NRRL F-5123]